MNFKKVFIDGNIIIDLFDTNRPFHAQSVKILKFFLTKGIEIYTSADLITTVYYVLSKIDKSRALKDIEKIVEIFNIIPLGKDDIKSALFLMNQDKKFRDLEDTIQYILAKKANCDLILTNDKKFFAPDILLLSTEQFLKTYLSCDK